jgi:hypothetical protein
LLGKVITDREACLTAAHDHGLVTLWLITLIRPASSLHVGTALAFDRM